jgi:ribose/xylose/arabinose/galactoside ABC-type transport system permease subunit
MEERVDRKSRPAPTNSRNRVIPDQLAVLPSRLTPGRLREILLRGSIWFIFIGIFLIFSALTSKFFTFSNLINILFHSAPLGVMAIGESVCLLCGKFDLSVGSIAALCGSIAGWLMVTGQPAASGLGLHPALAIPVILLVGILAGLFNGVCVGKLDMNPLLTTLATMFTFRGLALIVTSGHTLYGFPKWYRIWGGGSMGFIPIAVVIMVCLYFIFYFVLTKKRFGRHVYATGGNAFAAEACGVRVDRVIVTAYILSGILAATAGILSSGRLNAAHSRGGEGMELQAVAAAVIGGISLRGGRGSLINTIAGVLALTTIDSGLVILGVPSFWVQAVSGIVIFIAILFDTIKTRLMHVE